LIKKKTEEVKTIIDLMAKTFSQMRIFSSEHENVKKFTEQLFQKLNNFLENYWKLEIGIEELSFSFAEEIIYTDKQLNHSLPFLFYKDGMKTLFFYKNLKKDEFIDFLEIIKFNSSLPADESDIVSSFWEHDFANIRYFAPDDYLESKIGTGMETLDYQVDKAELFSGKIELLPEDRQALSQHSEIVQKILKNGSKQADNTSDEIPYTHDEKSHLNQKEIEILELMLEDSRKISPDDELISLLFEMLYLEERPEHFSQTLEILKQCQLKYLSKNNFKKSLEILNILNNFKQNQPINLSYKKESIDEFINSSKDESALADIKIKFQEGMIQNFDAYFSYLEFLAPATIPLFAYLYDEAKSSQIRDKILNKIKKTEKKNISLLMKITSNDKPELTKEIISILGEIQDKEAVKHLASFFGFENKSIQTAVISTLGKFHNRTAEKILLAYLSGTDEELRTAAIKNLHSDNKSILTSIIQSVQGKEFYKKCWPEKKALIDFLCRTKDIDACSALTSVIKRAGMFSKKEIVKTSLYAVSAIKKMTTLEAENTLKINRNSRNKKIREACRKA
jgi:hypothetical protein